MALSPLQAAPVGVRTLGFAFVGVLALAFLYVVVRYDESRESPAYDDGDESEGLPSFGPAYGAGGDDVETVLGIDGGDDPADTVSDESRDDDGWGSGTPDWDELAGVDGDEESAGDEDSPPVLSHEVVDDSREAVVVAVTDGDRTGRFSVEDPDANPSITPIPGSTERLDDQFRRTAEDYLRAVVLAGDLRSTDAERH